MEARLEQVATLVVAAGISVAVPVEILAEGAVTLVVAVEEILAAVVEISNAQSNPSL